ncbi:MAG: integrase, partial [Gammaproteobacteria bacterium]|nr:integrase [Gammaproteobacteria bacterium]
QRLSNGTLKNRLSAIRFALNQMGKSVMLPQENKALSIGQRQIKPIFNRAITSLSLNTITNSYVAYSLRLQQCFGLRRQEAIKFIVSQADKEHYIDIKGSWTKGGVPRQVPITTAEQRQLLNELHCFCKRGQSLIPENKSYRQQLNMYVSQTRFAGLKNLHGLRHAYAQVRYRVLTDKLTQGQGWEAPINGGLPRGKLSPFQKEIDQQVRELISNELGHRRVEISASYLA